VTETPTKIEELGAPVEEEYSVWLNPAMERQVPSVLDLADPEYSGGGGGKKKSPRCNMDPIDV